ncbi:hypothetical protein CBR_g12898 [Chara braunii]|uniref:Uncharacterized protein n=1 Tax=Chara braunii TaxID=69332 RepID=A0A388KSZ6_CHABU|nr:hypothetical protein CBR_g12898 [Chara braunii]|eukprot:GBG73180.1 hypothetical protein CBR_g12898 [Chara braunii]
MKLSECKWFIECGEAIQVCHLRRWKPKTGPDKKFLVSLLRNPRRIEYLRRCSLEVLTRLNGVAGDFQKQSTIAFLRRLISRTIRSCYGWSIGVKLTVRLKFDDRIKVVEVRKLLNDVVLKLDLPTYIGNAARNRNRIVWVKNPSAADLLHNQREYARSDVLTCSCTGLPYPRIGGHVQCRLQNLDNVHPLLCNANNIPKLPHPDKGRLLMKEVCEGFECWANFRGTLPTICRTDVDRCMTASVDAKMKCLDVRVVRDLKIRLNGLVLTPLDRNPGETLVLCPKVYYEAMLELFVRNPGYVVVDAQEALVKAGMKEDVTRLGLQSFVRWEKKGHFGEAYVMPK